MNATALASTISTQWDEEIVPQLIDYIRIPAKSPHFDPQWAASGHIERVIRLAEAWVKRQPVRGLTVEIVHFCISMFRERAIARCSSTGTWTSSRR